jgi:hypothetical protein
MHSFKVSSVPQTTRVLFTRYLLNKDGGEEQKQTHSLEYDVKGNAVCGATHRTCAYGAYRAFTENKSTTSYTWTCDGFYSGDSASCVEAIAPQCNNSVINACNEGMVSDDPDSASQYLWHCTDGASAIDRCSSSRPQYLTLCDESTNQPVPAITATIEKGDVRYLQTWYGPNQNTCGGAENSNVTAMTSWSVTGLAGALEPSNNRYKLTFNQFKRSGPNSATVQATYNGQSAQTAFTVSCSSDRRKIDLCGGVEKLRNTCKDIVFDTTDTYCDNQPYTCDGLGQRDCGGGYREVAP